MVTAPDRVLLTVSRSILPRPRDEKRMPSPKAGQHRRRGPAVAWQQTVHNHVSNILAKRQVADRAQVILQTRDAGLGHLFRTRRGIRPAGYPILPATAGTPAS